MSVRAELELRENSAERNRACRRLLPRFAEVLDQGRLGQLFATGDPVDLAARAVGLLDDPGRRLLLASRAREAARREYDWASVAPRVEAVYHRVLARDVMPSGRRSSRSA